MYMDRAKIVIANWKMNLVGREADNWLNGFDMQQTKVEVVICPSFTTMAQIYNHLPTGLKLGAQNCYYQPSGAYTGEVSLVMLQELGVHYVLVGHSERRSVFGESDELVNCKLRAVIAANMVPVLCVGETLEEREGKQWQQRLEQQLRVGLRDTESAECANIIVAYEPVWAIGTGRTAMLADVEEVHSLLREILTDILGDAVATTVRILYGGSVKSSNSKQLLASSVIDGLLVGGASLKPDEFGKIAANF